MSVMVMDRPELSETEVLYQRRLDEQIGMQEQMILGGNFPGGYDRYQRECGVLRGLRDARDIFDQTHYRERREEEF